MLFRRWALSIYIGLISIDLAFAAKELDRVYAIVNDDVITKSEYDQERLSTELEIKSRGRALPDEAVLQRQILDRMINERLQLQIADRAGIVVSRAQVDSTLQGIAQRNNISLEQLKQALANDGVSFEDFTRRLEQQLKIQQIVERQINSRVTVSDQEVEEFLRSESLGTGLNAELNVSHIVVPVPQDSDGYDQARARIERALQALEKGEDFAGVAAEYSSYSDAIEGGVLGWRKTGELPSFYYQALRGMSEGDFSEILQSDSAFHIVRLNGIRSAQSGSNRQITQVRLRQIFLQFEQNAAPEYLRIRLNEIAERLSNGEDFAALAELYSEDANSRIKGGDMGWINPGDLGTVIENMVFQLPIGQISEPVQVGNGISIFEVTDKRKQDAGNLFEKNAAREQLHIRKAEQMYQEWVQGLRDRAYVQYLVDDIS